MVVSKGHQSKRVNAEVEDEDADEESDEESPASAITTHTQSTKLGNDMLTLFQSRGASTQEPTVCSQSSESATCES